MPEEATPRVIFCGSRSWSDYCLIRDTMEVLVREMGPFEVVTGGARGADKIAESVGHELGLEVKVLLADWLGKGRAAGPARNREMLALGPIRVVAFKDDFDHSLSCGGTEHMVKIARTAGVPCEVHEHP